MISTNCMMKLSTQFNIMETGIVFYIFSSHPDYLASNEWYLLVTNARFTWLRANFDVEKFRKTISMEFIDFYHIMKDDFELSTSSILNFIHNISNVPCNFRSLDLGFGISSKPSDLGTLVSLAPL